MKKLLALTLALMLVGGCHYSYEGTPPAEPVIQDAPQPTAATAQPAQTNQPKPSATEMATPMPGLVHQMGDEIKYDGLLYRLNYAETTGEFQETEWCPLSLYERRIDWLRRVKSDIVPGVMVLNMTISNPTDKPVEECLYLNLTSLMETERETFCEAEAYDLRTDFDSKDYWYYTFAPGEKITCNFLYFGDSEVLEGDFRIQIGFHSTGNAGQLSENNTYIEFRAEE